MENYTELGRGGVSSLIWFFLTLLGGVTNISVSEKYSRPAVVLL